MLPIRFRIGILYKCKPVFNLMKENNRSCLEMCSTFSCEPCPFLLSTCDAALRLFGCLKLHVSGTILQKNFHVWGAFRSMHMAATEYGWLLYFVPWECVFAFFFNVMDYNTWLCILLEMCSAFNCVPNPFFPLYLWYGCVWLKLTAAILGKLMHTLRAWMFSVYYFLRYQVLPISQACAYGCVWLKLIISRTYHLGINNYGQNV